MLKELRMKKRMSQDALGKKLKISQSYVSRLESRNSKYHKNVTVELILKMSEILEINYIDLFEYFVGSILSEKQS